MTYSKCGGDDYDPSAEFCSGSSVYGKCGGSEYSVSTQRCESDVVETKCGSNGWYDDASMQFCSDGTIKTYKTVEIGEQVWMAENLNYDAEGSKCYNNLESNCTTYGRLYNWATAMALPSSCNSNTCSSQIGAKHQGICPSGWHIPSDAEWDVLMTAVGGSSTAGTKLKATSGWNGSGNGTDAYGFAALPGGGGYSRGDFYDVGNYGYWWCATESSINFAYRRSMYYYSELAYWDYYSYKDRLFSVRCLQD
jgi:uncharacterized protein (TIGR02145 family)